MADLNRWLRYWLPGALYLVLMFGWLVCNYAATGRPETLPDITGVAVVSASIAGFPIGFALSIVAHELIWCRLRIVSAVDNRSVLGQGRDDDPLAAAIEVEWLFRSLPDGGLKRRIESYVDLGILLTTGLVAVAAALVSIVTIWLAEDTIDRPVDRRVGTTWLVLLVCFAAAARCGQRRVSQITTELLRLALVGRA